MDASARGALLNKLADLIERDAVYIAVSVDKFFWKLFVVFGTAINSDQSYLQISKLGLDFS